MRKKIMVIDDEPEFCKSVALYLNEVGYDTHFAQTGAQGLKMIEEDCPDLLLLDILMPRMDGLEVMKQLIAAHPNLVVIVISGQRDLPMARKVIGLGAYEYLSKPVSLETLEQNYIRPILKNR